MGNDASRPMGDGLTPRGFTPGGGGGMSSPGGVLPSPRTPTAGRRAKSFSSSSNDATATTNNGAHPAIDRSIQRMDKTIRKRVRGGITYNMKIILRGDKGTGKTSLFQRLKGDPIPTSHEPTPQLQSATINWNFRANSEESIKCDVWDVVDKGFHVGSDPATGRATPSGENAAEVNPFGLTALQLQQSGNTASGAHVMATVDASTVDVYHETHGVVFLLDVTKPHTLEYVRHQLDHVPVHIPTLVLGNFRDCGNQRKIFKEDIHELLYGGGAHALNSKPTWRRPHELLYFECSLLNCYGLKALHQYLGIPFLQLKQQTIRQQLRIVENEFTHLKHDLQTKISEQRYVEYLDHIKSTGSDITTGRRISGQQQQPPTQAAASGAPLPETTTADAAGVVVEKAREQGQEEDEESPRSKTRLDRTQSSSSDIVVTGSSSHTTASHQPVNGDADDAVALEKKPVQVTTTAGSSNTVQIELEEDLPERTAVLAAQVGGGLKIEYSSEERRRGSMKTPPSDEGIFTAAVLETPSQNNTTTSSSISTSVQSASVSAVPADTQVAGKAVMHLEDFQVPKPRYSDLDHFYSDEDSDEEEQNGDDDTADVVVGIAPNGPRRGFSNTSGAKHHKQKFVDSDDEDDDESESDSNSRVPKTKNKSKTKTKALAATSVEPPAPAPPPAPPTAPAPARPVTATMQRSPRRPSGSVQLAVEEDVSETVDQQQPQGAAAEATTKTASPPPSSPPRPPRAPASPSPTRKAVTSPLSSPHRRIKASLGVATAAESAYEVAEEEKSPLDSADDATVDDDVPHISSQGDVENGGEDADQKVESDTLEESVVGGDEVTNVELEEEKEQDMEICAVEAIVQGELLLEKEDEEEDQGEDAGDDFVVAIDETPLLNDENESDDEDELATDTTPPPLNSLAKEDPSTSSSSPVYQLNGAFLDDSEEDEGGASPPMVLSTHESAFVPRTTDTHDVVTTTTAVEVRDDDDVSSPQQTVPAPVSTPAAVVAASMPPAKSMQRLQEEARARMANGSPSFAPAMPSGSLLDDFLNDSGSSDSDQETRRASSIATRPVPVSAQQKKKHLELSDEEEDDDEMNDRFAAYNSSRQRAAARKTSKSKSKSKTLHDEFESVSLSSAAASATVSAVSSASENAFTANQDVLAAIRQAEQDARRMLMEEATPSMERSGSTSTRTTEDRDDEMKKPKKKKTSLRKTGGRNDDENEEPSTKIKSKKKSKKETGSTSSRSSKRREMILTDEDEP